MTDNIRLEFEKSRSPCFNESLELARRFPSFQEQSINGVLIYSVGLTPDYFDKFIELARLVQGWKSSHFKIGSRLLMRIDFYKISSVYDCYRRRQEFKNRRLYCFVGDDYYSSEQIFPCKFIRITRRDLISDERYGRIDFNGILYLNKERIIFEIEHRLRLTLAIFCPDLEYAMLQSILEQLPGTVSKEDREKANQLASFCTTIKLPLNEITPKNIYKQ